VSEHIYETTNSGKVIPKEEVVRCRECRHRILGDLGKMCIGRHPEDFCSYGERWSRESTL